MVYSLVLVVLLMAGGVCSGKEIIDLQVNFNQVVRKTSDKFLSVQFDDGLIQRHWQQIDFGSQLFSTLCKGLYPAYVRIGGTAQDMLHFQPDGHVTSIKDNLTENAYWDYVNKIGRQPFVNFNLTGKQLDQLYHFFALSANFTMVFGLNALIRIGDNWDPSNAVKLLDYTSKRGYQMDFQLGNADDIKCLPLVGCSVPYLTTPEYVNRIEVERDLPEPEPNDFYKYNFTVEPQDLGEDFLTLRKLMDTYQLYKTSQLTGPDTTRPNHKKTLHFLDKVIKHATPVLNAVTWHQYYTNGRTATIDDFLDPALLDDLPGYIFNVTHCVENYTKNPVIWLGETASTFGGGTKGLSDRYVAGFMWLDKLGLCAKLGMDVVIRQAIIGGNYALIHHDINTRIFSPNPDYWLSFLYKALVGEQVLNVTVSRHSKYVRIYSHCTNTKRTGYLKGSITVYGLNLLEEDVTIILPPQLKSHPIEQYLLTPHLGDLTSQFVDLNGEKLDMVDDTTFPKMEPVQVKSVSLPSRTFGFFVLPKAAMPACLTF
ncbi:heparanase-like isoform X2 [Lineus longissimus]